MYNIHGVAERMNQTLVQRARCMRIDAGLSKQFWVEAVNTAAYLVNKSPSTAIDFKTPQEVWSGKPSNYSGLKILVVLYMLMLVMTNWSLGQ